MVCTQTGNSLFKRNFKWTDSEKGFQYFVPPEGYGHGIAGGAIIVPYKNWTAVNGYKEGIGIYGGNDGNLTLSLFNKTKKPISVIKDLVVFHFPEDSKEYQQWKDNQHQSIIKTGKSDNKGFYDDNTKTTTN